MPVKIFFCYAHEDEALLNKLKTHLKPLQRKGLIDVWYDRDISAGTKWEKEIDKHLNEANIILLLVSPDFMDSDYCYGTEMKRALERDQRGEACVIPIILRPVYWQDVLGDLQALPTDAKPVMSSSWQYPDEALYSVTGGIRKVIEEITPKSSLPPQVPFTPPVSQTPFPTNLADKSQKTKEQWLVEGNKYRDPNQYSEGLAAYEQAIRLDPNLALAYQNKGAALNGLNRNREAQQAYEKARQLGYSR